MHQRLATYCRPLPFMLGGAAFLFGLHNALNWAWDWSLQTGNIFIQISIPTRLLVFTGIHLLYWILCGVGLVALLVFGTMGRRSAKASVERGGNPFWAPRFRWHPLTFLLGLFLAYYGIVFLFNASVTPDDTPAGYAFFVYLNYAGIVRRNVISILGLLLILTGFALATFISFRPGLGLRPTPRPAAPAPATHPLPAVEAAAPPVVVSAPRPVPAVHVAAHRQASAVPRPPARGPSTAPRTTRPAATRRPPAPSAGRSS